MSEEYNADESLSTPAESADDRIDFYGGRLASALPITFFIVWAIVQSGVLRIGDVSGLVVGMLLALIAGMFFVRGDWKPYADTIFDGMTRRVAATAIVAWLWAGMFAETLQAGGFVEGLVWAADALGVGAVWFPTVTFLLAALLATGIGTGYGTAVAFTTLFFPAGVLLGANPVLVFGAILSGAVFGDNLAPVSDTTIVSAVTQDADIGGVVASRFKYAILPALLAAIAYVVASSVMAGADVAGDTTALLAESSDPLGLVHLLSTGVVIVAAVRGRHIVEAISWGLLVAVAASLSLGLASISDVLVLKAPASSSLAESLAWLPIVETVPQSEVGVGGSLYGGAVGFFPLIVLTLLIVAGAQIMIRGGGFRALQDWLLENVATDVRRAETTMVLGTAMVNAIITINTAAEIAIAPYVSRIGQRFNLNGYRRANILDANTSALGYIFPWSGGLLAGYSAMTDLPETYAWFTPELLVNPVDVWPFVFHGWLLVAMFLLAAWTGFGREYISDRRSEEVARV